MGIFSPTQDLGTQGRPVSYGTVVAVEGDGYVRISCTDAEVESHRCGVLTTSEGPALRLAPGDAVLVWLPSDESELGVVLGRVGPSHTTLREGVRAADESAEEIPDTLVLEAKEQLTLRVGDGSITLRADGKIQIKGKDLVSHAQRLNRIKGGAVSIN